MAPSAAVQHLQELAIAHPDDASPASEPENDDERPEVGMGWLSWIVFGALAGWVASLIVPGQATGAADACSTW